MDASTLERSNALEALMASPGWQKHLRPMLESRRDTMFAALRDPSVARKAGIPDDFIRGQLAVLDMLLTYPAMVAETDRNVAVEEELFAQREQEYEDRARLGNGPGGTFSLHNPAHL